MAEWQPIETAPKDGTAILIAGGTYEDDEGGVSFCGPVPFTGVRIAYWDATPDATGCHECWNGGPSGSAYNAEYWHEPTHWMPLPNPPEVNRGE
jgi:hypothetical protein